MRLLTLINENKIDLFDFLKQKKIKSIVLSYSKSKEKEIVSFFQRFNLKNFI
jgi:hypothetical protein